MNDRDRTDDTTPDPTNETMMPGSQPHAHHATDADTDADATDADGALGSAVRVALIDRVGVEGAGGTDRAGADATAWQAIDRRRHQAPGVSRRAWGATFVGIAAALVLVALIAGVRRDDASVVIPPASTPTSSPRPAPPPPPTPPPTATSVPVSVVEVPVTETSLPPATDSTRVSTTVTPVADRHAIAKVDMANLTLPMTVCPEGLRGSASTFTLHDGVVYFDTDQANPVLGGNGASIDALRGGGASGAAPAIGDVTGDGDDDAVVAVSCWANQSDYVRSTIVVLSMAGGKPAVRAQRYGSGTTAVYKKTVVDQNGDPHDAVITLDEIPSAIAVDAGRPTVRWHQAALASPIDDAGHVGRTFLVTYDVSDKTLLPGDPVLVGYDDPPDPSA